MDIVELTPFLVIILIVIFFVGIVGVIVYSEYSYSISQKKRATALATIVHGIATISNQGNSEIEGVFQNAKFRIYYPCPGKKNQEPSVLIVLIFTARRFFQLELRRENWDTRISKRIGFVRNEVEVGDKEFDSAFLLLTPDRERCKEYFSGQDKRSLIRTIYDQGYTLAFSDEGILMTIPLQKRVPLPAIDTLQLKLAFDYLRLLIDDN